MYAKYPQWLLHLLSDDEPAIIVLATKILARVLVTNGPSYVEKFDDKTGGFTIMRYRLRRWWSVDALWSLCFATLFGQDATTIDLHPVVDIYSLMAAFTTTGPLKIVYPGVFPVIIAMLENGVRYNSKRQKNHVSPLETTNHGVQQHGTDPIGQIERMEYKLSINQNQSFSR